MGAAGAAALNVLVVSQAAVGERLGGTAIRAVELGRALTAVADVELAAVGTPPATVRDLPLSGYHPQDPRTLDAALARADVVVATPGWPSLMRRLRRSRARLLFDLYVPEALETVGGFPGSPAPLRSLLTSFAVDRLTEALRIGDGFVCAGERQRDLLLGLMLAERLIGPAQVDADPSLRDVLDVVAFGLPDDPPVAAGPGPRGAFGDRVTDEHEVILWNGGIWPWLDAAAAVRAVARLHERRPNVRLVFMGAATQVPAVRATEAAQAVAAQLGVLDTVVHFNAQWVPYEARADWLLGADCAISTHVDQLETRFAFRTRLLDCFWAGLPVVCTAGDDLADVVARRGAGTAVPDGDPDRLAAALETVLDRGRAAYGPAIADVAAGYTWPRVAEPLVRMVAATQRPPRRRTLPGPAQGLRTAAYRSARAGLNAVGLRDWPRL